MSKLLAWLQFTFLYRKTSRPKLQKGSRTQRPVQSERHIFRRLRLWVTLFNTHVASCGSQYEGLRDRQPLFSLNCFSHLLTQALSPICHSPLTLSLCPPCRLLPVCVLLKSEHTVTSTASGHLYSYIHAQLQDIRYLIHL